MPYRPFSICYRNVHFYDASEPGVAFGRTHPERVGFPRHERDPAHCGGSSARALEKTASGRAVATADSPPRPGECDVYCDGRCSLSGRPNHSLTLKTGDIEANDGPWGCIVSSRAASLGVRIPSVRGIRAREGEMCRIRRCEPRGVPRFLEWVSSSTCPSSRARKLLDQEQFRPVDHGHWQHKWSFKDALAALLLRRNIRQDFDPHLSSVKPNVRRIPTLPVVPRLRV